MTEPLSVQQMAQRLKSADNILILCHKNPDGDTIGCGSALYYALETLDKNAAVLCSDTIPARYAFTNAHLFKGEFEPETVVAVDVAGPETLKDLPLAEMGGGEAYAIIPRFEGESVTLYAVTMKEDATAEQAKNGTVYDGAVLLMCNESDIFANTAVELKLGEDSISFGPYISLMDGSVVTHDRVPVGMIQ